ncbi:MAG: ATP-binding protein [Candidatus Hydrogenedentes bacterium]|nr:ATP-binding protein [Candidatus Hydrogenedentota bacterium]
MALFRNTTEGDAAAAPPPQRLGELLVSSQLLTPEQLAEAEAEAEKSGAFLSKVMVQKGLITQDDINACFVKRCKIPHISLLDYEISADVLQLIPREVCEKYGLLPIDKLGRILTVAMVDPLDSEALAIIRDHCAELRLKPILCNWAHFEQVAGKYFAEGGAAAKGNEVTMESFGLAKLPPKSVAPPQPPAPKPAPAPATGVAPAAPGIDSAALVQAIQDGMRGVAQDIIGAVRGMQAPPAGAASTAPGIDSAALVQAIHDGMRGVSQDLLSAIQGMHAPAPAGAGAPGLAEALRESLGDIVRELAAVRHDSPAQSEDIANQVRDAVSSVMKEAIQPLVSRPAPEPVQAAAPELDTGALAEVLRDAIGGVLEEAMASLAVQIRAGAAHSESEAAAQQALVAELRSAQDAAASALQEVINSALAAQAVQGARLAELAEAAVLSSQQTTQLVEASLVQAGAAGGARARHSSVAAFGPASDDGSHAAEDERVREALEAEVPLETFTLDNYIAGKANAFTLQVSQSVARKPGGEYNPFFLYGNVGLGKTHLISAVGNQIQREQPGQRVGYVSASHFSRRLKDALAANAQDAFRDNYCHWDVLILDDIQFLGGRVEAQEEFFHIFNVLHQQGRQIIIASDKAPDRLGLLEQRLISRFSSGIVVEIKPPEWETRMQILRSHAGNSPVPEEILSLIAMRVPGDVRKMVGCLRKVLAFAAHSEGPMTVELATEILSHLGGEAAA